MQPQFLKALLELLAESDEEFPNLETLAQKQVIQNTICAGRFMPPPKNPCKPICVTCAWQKEQACCSKASAFWMWPYQSQEAFHRAFSRMFGVTPKALQQGDHHPSLFLKQPWRESLMLYRC